MYWDGEEVASGEVPLPRQVERTKNYIGMGTMPSHLPLKAGSGLHALSFYNDPSITIEQVRVRSGPEPILTAAWQLPMIPPRDSGVDGWLPLDGIQAAESSQNFFVGNAFDRNARSNITTCCGDTNWIEYALPTAKIIDRYYLLSAAALCPSDWRFQAQQCKYTRRVPYELYQPSCNWIDLNTQRGPSARCTNKDAEDPAVFRFQNTQSFARYRWQFSHAVTIAELGLGSSVINAQVGCDQAGHRRTQQEHEQQTTTPEKLEKDEMAEMQDMKSEMKELKHQMRALKNLLQQLTTDGSA